MLIDYSIMFIYISQLIITKLTTRDVIMDKRIQLCFNRSLKIISAILFMTSIERIDAQQTMANVQIRATSISDGVYILTGRGGNIGVSVGEDGVFLVDDQFALLTDKIKAAIEEITDKPIKFVVNTHWHGDHTGGNENMGKAGAIIVAHENVRKRMSIDQFNEVFNRTTPASPKGALPIVTFTDKMTFHWNGDDINIFHVDPAHTDGDAIIYFTKTNVVHMGDTYFNGVYPYIDVSAGGSIDGVIAAANRVISKIDDNTKIIPGHGPLSNKSELKEYRILLETIRNRIVKLIKEGKSKEEVIASKPTKDYDANWGGGFMNPDVWVGILYISLSK